MTVRDAGAEVEVPVVLGFTPPAVVIPDEDHPGFYRAGVRGGPYSDETIERHGCLATDLSAPGAVAPDLLDDGIDTVDLTGFADLQATLAKVLASGRIDDADAIVIRSTLDGARLPLVSGTTVTVMHVADEGLIMRSGGPNGRAVVGTRTVGMNGHGIATSVHADQDVFGTPLTQVMGGRAPELFRHRSPEGQNLDAGLMLVNLWIPLRQPVQPLVLGDSASLDRPRHQLRYGLPTTSFLERGDDMVVNDIWLFLHDDAQRWWFRSDLDHRHAWLFDTLSIPHGAGILPGEDVAEQWFATLEEAGTAVEAGDAAGLTVALASTPPADEPLPDGTPPGLRSAIATMTAVADEARRDPSAVCGDGASAWTEAAQAAREGVVRRSVEMRLVVALDPR